MFYFDRLVSDIPGMKIWPRKKYLGAPRSMHPCVTLCPKRIVIFLTLKGLKDTTITLLTLRKPFCMTVPLNTVLSVTFWTGMHSPVIELSSTEAFPFFTLPSNGICSPAHTNMSVPIATSLMSTDWLFSESTTVEGADTKRARFKEKIVTIPALKGFQRQKEHLGGGPLCNTLITFKIFIFGTRNNKNNKKTKNTNLTSSSPLYSSKLATATRRYWKRTQSSSRPTTHQ